MATDNNNKKDASGIPDNDPSKAMDSRKEVEQSPDAKTDQDFPGYPHYPAREDIMDQRNDFTREDIDVENLPNSRNLTGVSQRFTNDNSRNKGANAAEGQPQDMGGEFAGRPEHEGAPQTTSDDDLGLREGTEADVSDDERAALEDASYYRPTDDENNLRQASLDNTDLDGEPLNEESFGGTRSGAGLDIPGEVDETNTESMGQGDEENKYYSLGSDRQDQNEEDPYSGPVRDNDA
ncbi:hypothetical protein SAMN05444008_106128 [Cnuella takakiae]|uniref:Uncharacterized protein n=1 Tax=Cnuella takakiae TaxID=1302690 RepID=A0A1M5A6A4_9BACT|nr:hypothetical protein [Cnuella takakiae]OLY92084.1 hypothetical protein BUE76_09385 [Cnuella takakiae]SHF25657.1 hypothetical protein SAMN05444008_106128 [Cnuella takakiae]